MGNNGKNYDVKKQAELFLEFKKYFYKKYGKLENDKYVDVTDELKEFKIDIQGLVSLIEEFPNNHSLNIGDSLYHRLNSIKNFTIMYYIQSDNWLASKTVIDDISLSLNIAANGYKSK